MTFIPLYQGSLVSYHIKTHVTIYRLVLPYNILDLIVLPYIDLVWSDPEEVDGWAISPRGAGYLFGAKVTHEVNIN